MGPAHRARGAAGRLGHHQPRRPRSSADREHAARDGDLTPRDFRRLTGFLRGAGRELLREPAFDLVVRAPERAAVLLGMHASLVAWASFAPFATLVTGLTCETGVSHVRTRSISRGDCNTSQ